MNSLNYRNNKPGMKEYMKVLCCEGTSRISDRRLSRKQDSLFLMLLLLK
jgi:hypothetical protein